MKRIRIGLLALVLALGTVGCNAADITSPRNGDGPTMGSELP